MMSPTDDPTPARWSLFYRRGVRKPENPRVRKPESPQTRKWVKREMDNPKNPKITVPLDPDLLASLRHRVIDEGTTVPKWVATLIERALAEPERISLDSIDPAHVEEAIEAAVGDPITQVMDEDFLLDVLGGDQ